MMPARTQFARHGQSGATVGEWLPHLGTVVDDLCFIKSMTTDHINHAPAMTFLLTGHQCRAGRARGLGQLRSGLAQRNLPDYVVLVSKMQRPSASPLYDYYWGPGFLPSRLPGGPLSQRQ